MKPVYTLHIPGKPLCTLVDYGEYHILSIDQVDMDAPIIEMDRIDGVPVDVPLRSMSSMPYAIFKEKSIIYGANEYSMTRSIASKYRWTAVPILDSESIIEYEAHDNDVPFINDGYAAEVRDARYVVITPELGEITSIDLLIKSYGANGYESYSGRILDLDNIIDRIEGRYIYLTKPPVASGPAEVDIPYTYTSDSISGRFSMMQDRLQSYGKKRVETISNSLSSIPDLLATRKNQFQASSLYEPISEMISAIKLM